MVAATTPKRKTVAWNKKVNEVFIMEKVTAKIQLKIDNFIDIWPPWILATPKTRELKHRKLL